MFCIRGSDDSLCHTVGTGEDEIILFKVESFYGSGKERKVMPVFGFLEGKLIYKRGMDFMRSYYRRNAALIINQGINISLGKNLAKNFQHFFPATHSGQPIMDDGYAKIFQIIHAQYYLLLLKFNFI
jgi:hypothetical protein